MRSSTTLTHLLQASGLFFTAVGAWNYDVHNQIGFMAEQFLTTQAKWLVAQVLEPEYNGSIGRAAHWADKVSKTTHKYSYGWHWTSALDDPPRYCNLYYNRDCQAGGCSISQIANQTQILQGCIKRVADGELGPGNPDVVCQEALKWVVHFVGDLTEPMHNSNKDYGGNLFKVMFNGEATNMHQTWDRLILYGMLNFTETPGFPQDKLHKYSAGLVARINADTLPVPRDDWLLCTDVPRPLYCATAWGRDSNALLCDYVYGRYVEGSDLWNGKENYALGAFPLIELQLAKAAWRLGGWLNALAETGLGSAHDGANGRGMEGARKQMPIPGLDERVGGDLGEVDEL